MPPTDRRPKTLRSSLNALDTYRLSATPHCMGTGHQQTGIAPAQASGTHTGDLGKRTYRCSSARLPLPTPLGAKMNR